jgi:hypothetical protein
MTLSNSIHVLHEQEHNSIAAREFGEASIANSNYEPSLNVVTADLKN